MFNIPIFPRTLFGKKKLKHRCIALDDKINISFRKNINNTINELFAIVLHGSDDTFPLQLAQCRDGRVGVRFLVPVD